MYKHCLPEWFYAVLGVFFLFNATSLFAKEPTEKNDIFDFMFNAGTGFIAGSATEYVYENEKQISRLEWKEKFAFFINLDVRLSFMNIFLKTSFLTTLPGKTGFMRDYDYLLPNSTELTKYSEHDAHLECHINTDVALGYSFIIKNLTLSPTVGFFYTNRKWSAADGFYQYASSGALQGGEQKVFVTGTLITYEQKISYLRLSLDISYLFFQRLLIALDGSFFPYLWIETMDNHILRSLEFYDKMKGGIGGLIGFNIRYAPFQDTAWSLLAGFAWEKIPELSGTSAKRATGERKSSSFVPSGESSGFESSYWLFMLGINWKI